MNAALRLLLGSVLAGTVGGVVFFGLYSHYYPAAQQSAPSAADSLPADLSLDGLDGKVYNFSAWRGKLLLINFWATWCPPCKEEIPYLVAAQKKYGPDGLQIVGPAVDSPDSVKKMLPQLHINYPVLTATPDTMIALMTTLGNAPDGLPFSVLVGPEGKIIGRRIGAFNPKDLDSLIQANLPKASP